MACAYGLQAVCTSGTCQVGDEADGLDDEELVDSQRFS